MPDTVGRAGSCETGHGGMDDCERVGCTSGRRWALDASGPVWPSNSDDGIALVAWCGCKRRVEWIFPDYFCAVRDGAAAGDQVAAPARSESELRTRRPEVPGHSAGLCDRDVWAFGRTRRVYGYSCRVWKRHEVRRAPYAGPASRPTRPSGETP